MTNYSSSKPERGGCLTWWLGLSLVFSILAILLFLGLGSELSRRGFASLVVIGVVAIGVNLLFLYGIYEWKRWGVYGFAAASIISLVISIIGRTATTRDFVSPFIQIGLLWYLVKDKWDYFD